MGLEDLQARIAALPADVLARASESAAARLQARMRTGTATPEPSGIVLSVHVREPFLSADWEGEIVDAIAEAEGAT